MTRRRIWIASVAALGMLAAVALILGWRGLPTHTPGSTLPATPFRTMAEHNAFMKSRTWPYRLELHAAPSGGALLYFGTWHTSDPDDPQIDEMARLWQAFRPTVAATENRLGFHVGGTRLAIRRFGEFGKLYALAREAGVPAYTLEPSWPDEVREVTAEFPVEEATLFYTLRVFLAERGGSTGPAVDRLATHLLKKRGSRPGLAGSLPDLEALDALWDERFAELGPWRELPGTAVHPSADATRLQAIANLVNEARDRHAVRVLLDLVGRGERVFAVAGGSHVVKQEPVLRSGLGLSPVDPDSD